MNNIDKELAIEAMRQAIKEIKMQYCLRFPDASFDEAGKNNDVVVKLQAAIERLQNAYLNLFY